MENVYVYLKKHIVENDVIIAVCDAELLGKTLFDRDKNIKLYIDPLFYQGELVSIDKALEEIMKATIVNIIGKRIVEAALKKGLILRESIIEIDGVPHAQIINIWE